MCMSVPQIAERCTLISTSLWPTAGSGTSCIQMPGSALALTSAFMKILVDDAGVATGAGKGLNDAIQLRRGMRRVHLRANPRLAMRYHGKRKRDDVDAIRLTLLRHPHR